MIILFYILVCIDLFFSISDLITLVKIQIDNPTELSSIFIVSISTFVILNIILAEMILIQQNEYAARILTIIWGVRLLILPNIKRFMDKL